MGIGGRGRETQRQQLKVSEVLDSGGLGTTNGSGRGTKKRNTNSDLKLRASRTPTSTSKRERAKIKLFLIQRKKEEDNKKLRSRGKKNIMGRSSAAQSMLKFACLKKLVGGLGKTFQPRGAEARGPF